MTKPKSNNGGSLRRVVRLLDKLAAHEKLLARTRTCAAVIIGNEMRTVREAANISLREMARRLKCSAPYLSDMELGRRLGNRTWMLAVVKMAKQPNAKAEARRDQDL